MLKLSSKSEDQPDAHLAIHDASRLKLSQQIFHLVVLLTVLLHVAMVGRDVRLEHVVHQPDQTALLALTVLLQDAAVSSGLEIT